MLGHVTGNTVDQLVRELGETWTSEQLDSTLSSLAQRNVIWFQKGTEAAPTSPTPAAGRLRRDGLTSFQYAVFNTDESLAWLPRISTPAAVVSTLAASLLVGIAGLIALFAGAGVGRDLLEPGTPITYLLVVGLMVLGVSLHEVLHGMVLTLFGGRVHRMGVMLMYLLPAFFCDVTDGWRLPHRWQRTAIALAGTVGTFGTAGLFALGWALLPGAPSWLAVLAVMSYVLAVMNLIPFIKLDGYIALMSWVDEPNLRPTAMASWKRTTALLLAGRWNDIPWGVPWRFLYGLGCSFFPVFLLSSMAMFFGTLQVFGEFGPVLRAALVLVLVFLLGRGVSALLRQIRAVTRPRHWRRRVAVAAVVLPSLFLLFAMPMSMPHTGAYWVRKDGTIVTTASLAQGTGVYLGLTGLGTSATVGHAVVDGRTECAAVPWSTLVPGIDLGSGHRVTRSTTVLHEVTFTRTGVDADRVGRVGSVSEAGRAMPLIGWLVDAAMISPMHSLDQLGAGDSC